MSAPEDDRVREQGSPPTTPKMARLRLLDEGIVAGKLRTWCIRWWCGHGFFGGIALGCSVHLLDQPGPGRMTVYRASGAALAWFLAGLLGAAVETARGFAPRYSRVVARQPLVSLLEGLNAGVVVVEARIVSGVEEPPFVRPPLVLEDAAGARLYVPVLEDSSTIRALGSGAPHGPLLGDQTNGVLYRAGESVVFVGQVSGQAAEAPTYRGGASLGIDGFVADLAWLVYKGATRDEVVKMLQQREPSRVLFILGAVFAVACVMLSLVACFGN